MINSYYFNLKQLNELVDLFELANEENNELVLKEVLIKIKELNQKVKKMKLNVFYQMNMTD